MAGLGLTDNSGDLNGVGVNTDHEILSALTLDSGKSGFVSIASEKGLMPNGDRVVREVECSEDYRLRTENDNIWITDYPIGTAVNTRKFKTVLTTQTLTLAGARYELNSSGITTVSTGSMLQSWKYVPMYKANALYVEFAVNWTVDPVANWFAEWGISNVATSIATVTNGVFFRITSGQFRGYCVNAGVETYVDLGNIPSPADVHDFVIEVTLGRVYFWHESNLLGFIDVPNTQFGPTAQSQLPVFVRTYNAAVAPSVAIKLQVGAISASNGGTDLNRSWSTSQSAMGNSAVQSPTGTAVGQTANYANSTAPVSATLSNTAAGYTTLGGQFQFAAVAGAETDYALFSYAVPVGNTLLVRGIWVDSVNTGAAVATTPTLLQWAVGIGASAVSLATADAATTKSPAKVGLGFQTFAVGADIGTKATIIEKNFDVPLAINGGEQFQIILRMPIGTATASQVIRGLCGVNAYFE